MQQSYWRSLDVQLFAHPVQGKYRDLGTKPLEKVIPGEIWREQGVQQGCCGDQEQNGKAGALFKSFYIHHKSQSPFSGGTETQGENEEDLIVFLSCLSRMMTS